MGVGKETNQERMRRLKKERESADRTQRKKKLIVRTAIISAVSVVVTAAIITAVCLAVSAYHRTNKYLTSFTAFTSDNYTVDGAMLSYFFYDGYYGYEDYFKQQSYAAPDFTKSLKKQTFGDGYVWYDYLCNSAATQIKELLVAAEAAHDEGISLSQTELEAIHIRALSVDVSDYGDGVTASDIEKCIELEAIAMKYQQSKTESLAMDRDALEAYYTEYYKFFTTVNFRCLEIPYTDGSAETTTLPEEDAKKYSDELSAAADENSFSSQLLATTLVVNPLLTEEQQQQILAASYVNGYSYSEGDTVSEWLFDAERAVGDTLVFKNESTKSYTTYFLTSLPARNENPTVCMRQILFRPSTYASDEAAKVKAEEVLEQWQKNPTIDEFEKLVLTYSGDASSVYIGGLYSHISAAEFEQYMPEFGKWCFSSDRADGDCTVLPSSFGYHVVYYVSDGLPPYLAAVRYEESNNAYTSHFDELKASTTLTENENALKKLPA